MSDRLTAEQLGELEPGHPVTIETAVTGRRPSLATGTMVRTEPTAVIVAVPGRGGRGTYIERFSGGTASGSAAAAAAQLVDVSSDDRADHELKNQPRGPGPARRRRAARRPARPISGSGSA